MYALDMGRGGARRNSCKEGGGGGGQVPKLPLYVEKRPFIW